MKRGTAPFSLDRNGYHISWDAVPAWVCSQCGEPFFEAREVDLIQKALNDLDRESAALTAAGTSILDAAVSSLTFESGSGPGLAACLHDFSNSKRPAKPKEVWSRRSSRRVTKLTARVPPKPSAERRRCPM